MYRLSMLRIMLPRGHAPAPTPREIMR